MRSKLLILLVLAVFCLSIFPLIETASAWEKGHIKVVPAFKFEERYDSNIFYDRENPKHDFMSIFYPGILGEYGFGAEGKHKLMASYLAELAVFGIHHEQNYGNHDTGQGVSLDFDRITVDVNNRFQFTSSRAGTEFERRTLRKIDTFTPVLGLHFNKFDFDVAYQYYWVDYLSNSLQRLNRYENAGSLTGYVQVMPKTKALLEFAYRNLQYPDTSGRNGSAYNFMGGVKGEITAKITGIIKGGFGIKEYDGDAARKGFQNFVMHTALLYDINDRTDLSLTYYREAYESIYENNNYYTGDHILANLSYKFGGNFLAKLDGMFFNNWYPSPGPTMQKKRVDQEWAAGTGLDYAWREWLVAGVGYRFHQRASTVGSRRYNQHVVNGNIRFQF